MKHFIILFTFLFNLTAQAEITRSSVKYSGDVAVDGKIGVGGTGTEKIYVDSGATGSAFKAERTSGGASSISSILATQAGWFYQDIVNGYDWSSGVYIDNTYRVANGSTLNTNPIVSYTSTGRQRLHNGGTVAQPALSFSTDNDTGISWESPNILKFATGGSERIRINASGDVGIGQVNPTVRLSLSDTTSIPFSIHRDSNTPSAGVGIDFSADDSANNEQSYARIFGTPDTVTDGSEDGGILIQLISNGSFESRINIDDQGTIRTDGSIIFDRLLATIASGAITVTAGHYNLATEGAAATDNLDTINGGATGRLLILKTNNSAQDVTVRDNSVGGGNIYLSGNANRVLDHPEDTLTLIYDSSASKWLEMAYSNNN